VIAPPGFLGPILAWFIENLLWASAAMLVVLAIRRPVARYLGAGVAYALWLVPALRLVAPPASWTAQIFDTPVPSLPPLLLIAEAGVGAAPPPLGGPGQWVPILLAVWAGGACVFLIVQAVAYRRFLTRLSLSMRSAGTHGGLPLIESEAADGPLALGLLDRRIIVPADFGQRYNAAERQLALDHERYHHRRGDILANHLALAMLALHWFNPIAWAAFRAFRADQELSCDAAIAAAAAPEVRADYARALVKSASRPGLIAACPLNGADQLKRRLKMLSHHKHDRRRFWAGSAITASLIATSFMFGTAGQAQDKAQKEPNRMIILESRDGAPGMATGERREFRIRRGADGSVTTEGLSADMSAAIQRCQSQQGVTAVDAGEGKERNRIMICDKNGATPANRLEVLEKARARLSEQGDLSAESKQRILSELDRAIAAARGN
jgi:beta-lactamase regulating signal transducer with metallopeptidase domain